jgi:threonine/homoserine/homoserine lactone efflux protein
MERALIIGFFLGFILASPLGPMGLVCLRRTLTKGPVSGFTSALGISCADFFWSFTAINGLTIVSQWIERQKTILGFAIALFFILYGLHGIFNSPKTYYQTVQNNDNAVGFLATFSIVFLNPSTFISFVLSFTLFGVMKTHYSLYNSLLIASSVFAGSIVFWFSLTQLLHGMRKMINDAIYGRLSYISACIIMAVGIITLIVELYR